MIYDLKCIIKDFAMTFTLTTINPVVHRKIILHERQHHNEGIMTQKVAFIARNNRATKRRFHLMRYYELKYVFWGKSHSFGGH